MSLNHRHGYNAVKQVTRANFSSTLQEIKTQIKNSDFIAISTKKTGDFSSSLFPWRKLLPIDTPEVAYLKSRLAAETFQILQFAVCPFRICGSKVTAFPYNFHLFPRDELNLGMPSYTFSCQTSFLMSMAHSGFDFNSCIYDGISFLSRVQESKANKRNTFPRLQTVTFTSNPSVVDSLFMGRVKSRVEHWRNAVKNKDKTAESDLVNSLRKLILGDEVYGSRPCMCIDVCSDRQVQLTLEIVNKIGDDLVPLVIPDKGGGPKAVRVVLTSSDDDKILLMTEIENLEEEQNLKVRGFREVVDLVSSSQKPVITYSSLNDFTFIHSKFIAPLPPSLSEFMSSLRMAFPDVIDVSHLSKEVGPLKKAKNLPATMSYLKRQFFVPIELEIPQQGDEKTENSHGNNALRITTLFSKLHNLLKFYPESQNAIAKQDKLIEKYGNKFYPTFSSIEEAENNEDGNISSDDDIKKKVSSNNLVFLWGFDGEVTASELKNRFQGIRCVFSEDFELHLVDKSCSVIKFSSSTAAQDLIKAMNSEEIDSSVLREMISNGLKGTGYETYKKACELGLWEADLADSLDAVLTGFETEYSVPTSDEEEVYWDSELMIDFNSL